MAAMAAKEPSLSGWTPLHEAAYVGDAVMARALLAAGASIDAVDAKGLTPVQCAARAGQVTCLGALLAAGANLESADRDGATALLAAAT
jgi:ankyrin repeat protein